MRTASTSQRLMALQEVIGHQWSQSPAPERRQLLELARDALFFIWDTDRVTGTRRLRRNRDLEYYMAEFRKEGRPSAIASFGSREDAEAWLRSQIPTWTRELGQNLCS